MVDDDARYRLDLVRHKKHVMLPAELMTSSQVPVRGDHHAGLPLDGLHHKRNYVLAVLPQSSLQGGNIVVGDPHEPGEQRAETAVAGGIVAHGYGRGGAPVETAVAADLMGVGGEHRECKERRRKNDTHDDGFVVWDVLLGVAPFAGEFDGSFDCLSSGVHG